MPQPKTSKPNEETFETAMTRLEKIVEEMEDATLPLEDLIQRYEDGARLVKVCEERLATVEKKIEQITRTASGEPRLEEFEPAAATAPEPAAKARPPRDEVSLF